MIHEETIHAKIPSRVGVSVESINRTLKVLISKADDSYDIEKILGYAISSLYANQPWGQKNYTGENPRIGRVTVSRGLGSDEPSTMLISYVPSENFEKRWKRKHGKRWIYTSKGLGTIGLRERTCRLNWDSTYDETYFELPENLMRDTEKVMSCLGLKVSKQKRHS